MSLLPVNKNDEKQMMMIEKINSTQTTDDDNVDRSKKLFVVVSGKYSYLISQFRCFLLLFFFI